MIEKVIIIGATNNYRIIVISDIHGHIDMLKELIFKLNIKENDYLVILGDFINRGTDSFKTYRFIREFSKRENTYVLKGNHELGMQNIMSDQNRFESLHSFFYKQEGYENIVNSILKSEDIDVSSFSKISYMYEYLIENHIECFKYFSELPIMLEIDEFRFVHGGYDEKFSIKDDEMKFLKFDNYNEYGMRGDKTNVVGHSPVCTFRNDKITNVPYYNKEKNFIFVDGGIGVKKTGELNGVIIEKQNGKIKFDYMQVNNFEKKIVKEKFIFPIEERIYVNYPHYDFEILKSGERMSICRHIKSGKEFSVFNSLISFRKEKLKLKVNYINNFLNLNVGDEVEVCNEYEDCVLVKYGDEFGWLRREQL